MTLTPEEVVAAVLDDVGGDRDAALLTLAALLIAARAGMSAGLMRLPPRLTLPASQPRSLQ